MNKIQRATVAVTLLIAPFFLLQMVHADMLYPVQVDYQPTQVKIKNINVKKEHERIIVSGVINRRSYNTHTLPGHLDIQVFDNQNVILQQSIISVSGLNLRRNRNGRQFRLSLGNELPKGSYIKVNWHQNMIVGSSHIFKHNSLL